MIEFARDEIHARPRHKERFSATPMIQMLFVFFPFTQIIPLASYNQPYAFFVAFLIVCARPSIILNLPPIDRAMLIYLAVLGCLLFLFATLDGLVFREVSFLLSYLTPFFITVSCYWVLSTYPNMFRKTLTASIFAWISLGVIQSMGFPDFLTFLAAHSEELGSNIALSGRGALGFAPEPTHFGFHMVLLGSTLYILRGPIWVVGIAFAAALMIAKSSSALLALGLALLIWGGTRPIRRLWIFISCLLATGLSAAIPLFLDDSYRITGIILQLYYSGFDIFLMDYSINARLSGAFAPFYLFFDRAFLPLGLSLNDWDSARSHMLNQFSWIINLSSSGPASGFGLILLQGGIFGLPVFIYFSQRYIFALSSNLLGYFTAASFMVFIGQLFLATPTSGLVLAAIIFETKRRRAQNTNQTA